MVDEHRLDVMLEEEFDLQLKENRDIGERWDIEYNLWAMRIIKDDYSIPKLRFRTTKGLRTVTFKVYKTGEFRIRCKHLNTDGDVTETKNYRLKCHR